MGFFSNLVGTINPVKSLKNIAKGDVGAIFDPSHAILEKPKGAKKSEPFDPKNRVGASINGESGVDQPSMRLGWTNGGYNYHNSPWNTEPAGAGMQAPTMGKMQAPNMGFGPPTGPPSGPKMPQPMPMPQAPGQARPMPMGQPPPQRLLPGGNPGIPQPPMPGVPSAMGMPQGGQMDPRMMQQMMLANQLRQSGGGMMR